MRFEKGNKHGNRFSPGESGNGDGRPKLQKQFVDHARSVAKEGLEALILIGRTHEDASMRIAAWKVIFERAFGKPKQEVDVTAMIEQRFVIALPAGTPLSDADDWQLKWGNKDVDLIEDGQ